MDQKASDLFRICDKEDKGFVTKRDMQRMRNLEDGFAGGMDPEQLESVFDTLDSDGNGYLTLEEFSAGFQIFIGVPVGLETIGEIVEVKINRYTFSFIYLEVIIFEIKCSTKEHISFQESLFEQEDAYGGGYCSQSGHPKGMHGSSFHPNLVHSIYQ